MEESRDEIRVHFKEGFRLSPRSKELNYEKLHETASVVVSLDFLIITSYGSDFRQLTRTP